ncbi:hypothetical protein CUZ93_0054 [Enterococcus xinjiangensis]|nr:hypothetical protein [Enterococcus lactis]MBL4999675.1 hypothetical protein [Enterococcus lactis]
MGNDSFSDGSHMSLSTDTIGYGHDFLFDNSYKFIHLSSPFITL